jgi:hypothetical protein
VVAVVKRLKVQATCPRNLVSGKPSNQSARGVDIPPTTCNLVFRTPHFENEKKNNAKQKGVFNSENQQPATY